MKLSAPIYVLKSQARKLKVEQNISQIEALNIIARREGFAAWSRLMARQGTLAPTKFEQIVDYLNPSDLVLVAAPARIGKTVFVAGLAAQALHINRVHWFSLVESEQTVHARLDGYLAKIAQSTIIREAPGQELSERETSERETSEEATACSDLAPKDVDINAQQNGANLIVDCSDHISAKHIMSHVGDDLCSGTFVVVDYLQMLDEKRVNPPLQEQVVSLKKYAQRTGAILIFVCQVDRRVGERARPCIDDIRLPNPLDIGLFNKIFFLSAPSHQASSTRRNQAGAHTTNEPIQVDILRPIKHQIMANFDRRRMIFTDSLNS